MSKNLNVGTKSVLFGAHCWFLHPWFVAWAWWKLYGFPWDPRLWVAFFVHDLGYVGLPNMDGPEGERHVEWGAKVMTRLFDGKPRKDFEFVILNTGGQRRRGIGPWGQLCLFHSRFYAKRYGFPFSRLCVADKLSFCLTPSWLYLPMVRWSGEIHEYMALAQSRTDAGEPKYASMKISTDSQYRWWLDVSEYLWRWVEEHRDGREDTWTPAATGNPNLR